MIDVHYRDLRDMLENTEKLYRDEVAYKLKFRSEIVGIKYSKFIDNRYLYILSPVLGFSISSL